MPEDDATALARIRRRFVALTALRWVPTGFSIPVTVLLLQERGLDLPTIGVIVALYSTTVLLLELPTGGLADTIGRRPVLFASAVLTACGSALLAVGTSVLVLATAYVVLGVSRALDSGPLQAWFVDSTHAVRVDAEIRSGLSRAGVAESVGLGLGALAAGALVALAPEASVGATFDVLAVPLVVGAVLACLQGALVLVWVHDAPRPGGAEAPARGLIATIASGLRLAASHRALRRILMLTAALGAALAGLELLAPPRFAALLGGESTAASAYAVLVTAGFAGSAAGSALAPLAARLMGAPARGAIVGALAAAGALACVALPSFWLAAVAFVAFYLGLGIGAPLVDELTHAAVSSAERATVLSLTSMALQCAGIVAVIGTGALAGATSGALSLLACAAALALGACALIRWPQPVS